MKYMRIVVSRYGGPEVLEVIEEECPQPRAGEVRVKVLAAGVSLPDVMMREGIHPEKPRPPFTPGWDLVGVVDQVGAGVSGIVPGQTVAALPITGAYAETVCLSASELVPVPPGLDPAEAVSLGLNYVTAWQMLHRAAHVQRGERALVHGGSGGVGTALLQLGRLAGLELYATCSARGAATVLDLGGIPIDYRSQDFVAEMHRLPGGGADVVFDSLGGTHIWRSRDALRRGGRVVAYGLTASLSHGRTADGGRHRLRGLAMFGACVAASWLLPGRKRVLPYSIQWLKRRRPDWYRQDLQLLLELLGQGAIRPLIAGRFALAEARQAHELLGTGEVVGKLVLVPGAAPREGSAARQAVPVEQPAGMQVHEATA
jgi:NADPH2:quinone reductase